MNIVVTNYGVTVNGNYIKFEGMTHDGFLAMLYIASGMTAEELMQYKQDRAVKGADQYADELLRIVTNVVALKANQKPLTDYSSIAAGSDYYMMVNSKDVTVQRKGR